jgi:hypothetical protein
MERITHQIHYNGISKIFREKRSLKDFREEISLKDFREEISLKDFKEEIFQPSM